MNFTFEDYIKLCRLIKGNNYEIVKDIDRIKDSAKRLCILRHDIDFSLEKAEEMAAIENEHGIISTYFIMISNRYYNTLSKHNQEIVRNIIRYGHMVGLHFDETVYSNNEPLSTDQLVDYIKYEAGILKKVSGTRVKAVSMHEPSERFLALDLQIPGMINCYSDYFFRVYKYLADSRMKWKEDVESVICSGKYNKIQILTHPFWYQKKETGREEILENFIRETCASNKKEIKKYYPKIR